MAKFRYMGTGHTVVQEVEGGPDVRVEYGEVVDTFHDRKYMLSNDFIAVGDELSEQKGDFQAQMRNLEGRENVLEERKVKELESLKAREKELKNELDEGMQKIEDEKQNTINKYKNSLKVFLEDDLLADKAKEELAKLDDSEAEAKDDTKEGDDAEDKNKTKQKKQTKNTSNKK